MKSWLFLLVVLFQDDVPYKANEDFEVTLDYQYKTYVDVESESKSVDYDRQRKGPLSMFYLITRVKIKNISPDEARVHVTSNFNSLMTNKKVAPDMVLKIDFGFIEYVKDRTLAHEYTVFLVSPEKKRVSRIHLLIERDGTFFVNGQKRGKF